MIRPRSTIPLAQVLQLDGLHLTNALSEIASFKQLLLFHGASPMSLALGTKGVQDVAQASAWIAETCTLLGAHVAAKQAAWLRDFMLNAGEKQPGWEDRVQQDIVVIHNVHLVGLKATCDKVEVLLNAALSDQLLYVIEPWNSGYMGEEGELSLATFKAFPDAAWDVAESAKCIALDRATASVFHSMRSLETIIDDLCKETGVVPKNPNWGAVLGQITDAVNKFSATSQGPTWRARQHFYSTVTAHLNSCKNAWRNYVAHGHEKYDITTAKTVLNGVKSFLNDYAKKP